MDDEDQRSAAIEAGRLLASLRRTITVTCGECGAVFEATTAGRYKRQFCSAKCRMRNWRRRKQQEAAGGEEVSHDH